jgi:hypothetical protein
VLLCGVAADDLVQVAPVLYTLLCQLAQIQVNVPPRHLLPLQLAGRPHALLFSSPQPQLMLRFTL